jgi:hypothetical protein
MSVRNGFALLLALSALLFLAACGSNGSVNNPVAPPSGSFSDSNLNGTYVFSVSGSDVFDQGTPYSMVGTLTANGSGGITSGIVDINDVAFAIDYSPAITAADLSIGNGSYNVTADGRGQIKFTTSNPVFGSVVLDFVLNSSSDGLVTEFDANATGSGTIDLQAAGVTPAGTYAFTLSGAEFTTSFVPWATVGNFALSGTSASGLADSNEDGILPNLDGNLTGSVVVASSPSTFLTFPQFGTLTFDVFPIDANHLKFIEMDETATLTGDAYSQTTTAFPNGTLSYTLDGIVGGQDFAAGGFMVTDGAGDILAASSEDIVEGTSVLSAPTFTANYTNIPSGSGRYTLNTFSGFAPTTPTYAAYPSSGGVLLLEVDSSGITNGAAYLQTPGATLASAQGFGLNLSGQNGNVGEVDDIAEFATNGTGSTVTGLIDENSEGNGPSGFFDLVLSGNYSLPPGGQITATANTENGGFLLNYYPVDGTTFPFIETDGGQVAAGVFVQQNPAAAASAAISHSHMFHVPPIVRPHALKQKKTK